jgi:hypothetical protein
MLHPFVNYSRSVSALQFFEIDNGVYERLRKV